MRTSDYAKAAGDILDAGFRLMIGLAIAFVVSVVVILALVVKIFIFPSDKAPESSATAKPSIVSPAVEIEYPKVTGLCFRTPMGDVGKVIAQQKDMLDMTFRGGVKATYQFNEVSHTDCGVLPAH